MSFKHVSQLATKLSIMTGVATTLLVMSANYEIRTTYAGCDATDDIFNKVLNYSDCSEFSLVLLGYLAAVLISSSLYKIYFLRAVAFLISALYFYEAYQEKKLFIQTGLYSTGIEFYYVVIMCISIIAIIYALYKAMRSLHDK